MSNRYAHLPEGEPQTSHAAGTLAKNGDRFTGVYFREGLELWWMAEDSNGFEYATREEPVIVIDLSKAEFIAGTPAEILASV